MPDQVQEIEGREGGFSNNPADKGGRTYLGISEKSNPDLWKDGPPSEEMVRDRYVSRYVKGPHFDLIPDPHLQAQLIDFGVNSGSQLAIQKLQTILGVGVDGVIGDQTLSALKGREGRGVNNLLLAERVRMLGRIVSRDRSQIIFLNGWLERALSFLV